MPFASKVRSRVRVKHGISLDALSQELGQNCAMFRQWVNRGCMPLA